MKAIPNTSWKLLPSALTIALTGTAFSASLIDSGTFFDPALRARRPGATSGLLTLAVNNNPITVTTSSGATSWEHTAEGLIQTRANLSLSNLDVQVAGYTETTGNELVFGREITTTGSALGNPLLTPTVNQLVSDAAGATGISYGWSSDVTATVPIVNGQQYRVSFEVTTGTGLSIGLLDTASFGIATPGITGISGTENAQLLNLLDILQFGSNRTGEFHFDFTSDTPLNALDFVFSATDTAGARLLGGQAGNENVLTFSNFEINAIPEPSSLVISGFAAGLILLRRKRVA